MRHSEERETNHPSDTNDSVLLAREHEPTKPDPLPPSGPVLTDEGDEPPTNFTNNKPFAEIVEQRFDRRTVLSGGSKAAVATFFGATISSTSAKASIFGTPSSHVPLDDGELGFQAVPVYSGDEVV